jgi:hypothetical protein
VGGTTADDVEDALDFEVTRGADEPEYAPSRFDILGVVTGWPFNPGAFAVVSGGME